MKIFFIYVLSQTICANSNSTRASRVEIMSHFCYRYMGLKLTIVGCGGQKSVTTQPGLPNVFSNTYQNDKICNKWPQNIPNGHKIHQNFTFQGVINKPKFGFFGIQLYLGRVNNFTVYSIGVSLCNFLHGTSNVGR
jgi:hypothetical protein